MSHPRSTGSCSLHVPPGTTSSWTLGLGEGIASSALSDSFQPKLQTSSQEAPIAFSPRNDFQLDLAWVKALPGGQEADFVLVSCVGAGLTGETRRKMVLAKRCVDSCT